MNDKLRSVNTKFWDDSFVQEINPSEKLLFLYLLTNPLTNLLGVYEITEKRIAFDTGLNLETIRKGFERFGRVGKAYFLQNFVILPNWLKNQRLNPNMKIAVAREFNDLPKELKSNILGNHSEGFIKGSEGFVMVKERLGKYEIEIESEIEDKIDEKRFDFKKSLLKLGIEKQIVEDWLKVRRKKQASNTLTAFNRIKKEINKCELSPNDCIKIAVEKNWSGFEAKWIKNIESNINNLSNKEFLKDLKL